jgi:hypothetical protein
LRDWWKRIRARAGRARDSSLRYLGHLFLRALRALFLVVAICLAALLLCRSVLALTSSVPGDGLFGKGSAIFGIFAVIVVFYSIFLLEGLVVSGGKLKDVEDAVIGRYARSYYAKHEEKILNIAEFFRANYAGFLTGQQIITILLIVFLDTAMSFLSVPSDQPQATPKYYANPAVDWLNSLRGGLGDWTLGITHNGLTTFLISTLLLCWVSQLAPGFLSDKREIGFLRLPCTYRFIQFSRVLSAVGVGYPGEAISRLVTRRKAFQNQEHIGISPAEAHRFLSEFFGISVRLLSIRIRISRDAISVTETSEYEIIRGEAMVRKVRGFQHVVRSPVSGPAEFFPIESSSANPAILEGLEIKGSIMRSTEDSTTAGETAAEPVGQRTSYSYVFDVTLPGSLPGIDQTLTLAVPYRLTGPRLDRDDRNTLVFEISKPTKVLEILILPDTGLRVRGPDLTLLSPDDLAFDNDDGQAGDDKPSPLPNGADWAFRAPYPTLNARAQLVLNIVPDRW